MKNPMNDIIATWESMGGKIKYFADTCIAKIQKTHTETKESSPQSYCPDFLCEKYR